ncbi:MAG TPA: NAD(P)-dependent oxidoreductase [Devosiaceae bacterium]|jgi:nucleoside-diphosphate-sugar epimerase
MSHRIFLAGASGVIGKRLIPLLVRRGHHVTGTTRSSANAVALEALGIVPRVVDVFDAAALAEAVLEARPDIVIHQLTDLPQSTATPATPEALTGNARIRDEGTRNLVAAAVAAGVRRMVAQSITWGYAPGALPHDEAAPLDLNAEGVRGVTVNGMAALERQVLSAPGLTGIVLRYGRLYGPETGVDLPPSSMPLHVDAAAYAAFLAMDHGEAGIFNVAEPSNEITTDKISRQLGWDWRFRLADAS